MAFAIVGAQVPDLEGFLNPGLTPRVVDYGLYPAVHARNSSTTTDTVNMFIDAPNSRYGYAVSVVTACKDQTIYALQCTSGPATVGSKTCGPNADAITVTSGASFYKFSSAITSKTMGYDVTVTAQESCSLTGTTAAICAATVKATVSTSSTVASSTETLSGSTYYRFDVAITGGAEKTAAATGACVASAASGLSTKNIMIWGLAGVVGFLSMQTMV